PAAWFIVIGECSKVTSPSFRMEPSAGAVYILQAWTTRSSSLLKSWLSTVLQLNAELGHVVRNVGLYCLRRDYVAIAAPQIALPVLGHASAEERVRSRP